VNDMQRKRFILLGVELAYLPTPAGRRVHRRSDSIIC